MFSQDVVSEAPERFFIAEIVREQVFLQYQQEIPYSSTVRLQRYVEFCEISQNSLMSKSGHELWAIVEQGWIVFKSPDIILLNNLDAVDFSFDCFVVRAERLRCKLEPLHCRGHRKYPQIVQAEVTEYIGRDDGKDLIRVTVTVETESQRGIMIGRGGAALKQLSMASRHGIEDFLGESQA